MLRSLKFLYEFPYNKKFPVFALFRFLEWKFIRLFKLTNYKKKLWGDRHIYLNYDSFQSMWIMYHYIVDWEEFNLIQDYVKEGSIVADIGTNMGFYTIWMSKFIGKSGHIHSFEPDAKNFKRLNENIGLNNLGSQVSANNTAVSDEDGFIKFTTGLDGENHISKNDEKNIKEIACIQLDTYFKTKINSNISYMKIDVEGFEYMVLHGASNLLNNKSIDILQLEINKSLNNSESSTTSLIQFLNKNDYYLCKYDLSTKTLIKIDYLEDRENYFAVNDIKVINNKLQENIG